MKHVTIALIALTTSPYLMGDHVNAHRSLVDEHTTAATNKCQSKKACIKEVQAVIDITPSVSADSNGKRSVIGNVINTIGNKVDIDEHDTCAVFEMPQADGSTQTCIVCSSGKFFENVCSKEGSATGTPGSLMYDTYIGAYYHPKASSGLMGADRRTIYCISECK
ncbi:MAG: hypothetical protein ACHQVS_05300 [Candidatus Babeliales bacterium]